MVSTVPTACRGAISVTNALNWAESVTTKNPQIQATAATSQGLCPKKKPMVSEQAPLAAIANVTSRSLPMRSAAHPPHTQPKPPTAIARKAMTSISLLASAGLYAATGIPH